MKYRTAMNSFLLVFYFVSLLAGVFHHHHFDFSTCEFIATGKIDDINQFQLSSLNKYECIIQHNLVKLQTSLVKIFGVQQLIASEYFSYCTHNCEFCKKEVLLSDNLLRAPPTSLLTF